MGKIDDKTEDYFDNNYRFADMWNGFMYRGESIIDPDDLVSTDRVAGAWNKNKKYRRVSDVAKLWNGKYLRLLVLENQSYVDYRMVLRNMLQESIAYNKQWRSIKDRHMEMKDLSGDEYLSGMSKTDKYIPVITLVINLSSKKWDGALNLYDILELGDDPQIKEYINDYKINLYDYHNYDDFDEFKTSLKNLFEFIRYSEDEEIIDDRLQQDERYKKLDLETVELINDISKIKVEIIGGRGNMCKAFEDHKLAGKMEGIIEGKIEGKLLDKIELIIKKYAKGKALSQIADELESTIEEIEKYYNLVASNEKATADEIYELSLSIN